MSPLESVANFPNMGSDWDNDPITLRHLWLRQASACWMHTSFGRETVNNPNVYLHFQEDAFEKLVQQKSVPEDQIQFVAGKLKVLKSWRNVQAAKKAFENAGGKYKENIKNIEKYLSFVDIQNVVGTLRKNTIIPTHIIIPTGLKPKIGGTP